MANSTVDPSWPYSVPMEPIPEEDDADGIGSTTNVSRVSQSPRRSAYSEANSSMRTFEQKQRTKEIYTSEQVDTLVSTVPKTKIPESWNQFAEEQVVVDPEMTSTYITENLAGPASARGTTYAYTYETQVEDPENLPEYSTSHFTESIGDDLERHTSQTQKVTRVTKVTTTRSVRQVPVNPNDIFFDADGNPVVNGYAVQSGDYLDDGLGIDLSRTYISEHEEYNSPSSSTGKHLQSSHGYDRYYAPSAPGMPQVIDIDTQEISLAWLRPEVDGTAGPVIGYRVEFRHSPGEPWEAAHDDLLLQTECRITNLDSLSEYQFRVLAANSSGFGVPSNSTPPIQLRPKYESPPKNGYAAPTNPTIVAIEGDRCTLQWQPPYSHNGIPVSGYIVEYRTAGTSTWVVSNDYPTQNTHYDVTNLRPNGEYEFRVTARYDDGSLSDPSYSTGFVKVKPMVPLRSSHRYNPDLIPPGQPQVLETDSTWVQLHWSTSPSADRQNVLYVVEMREIGDPTWYTATTTPIVVNELIIENLHSDSTYEFRVSTVADDGSQSEPSDPSEIIRLRPITRVGAKERQVPERPQAPEYLDFDGGSSVTLCWVPANSILPVEGYEVEFRDFQQDATQWFKVTDKLVYSCKTTVGYLIHGHQYQFRVVAKNAVGYSDPSDASAPITIGKSLRENSILPKDTKYVEAERFGAISLLQDEIIRESPPLPDRDDSPPPMNRQPNYGNLHWRDPTLKEVIDYLKNSDPEVQRNASGYLQHLTFNDSVIKEETRNLGGIPLLIRLLDNENSEIQRNACGCLKNLAFGRENDENKKVIMECNGVKSLANVVKTTSDPHVKEEATGALWNISSCDELKEPVLNQVVEVIVNNIVVPGSGYTRVDALNKDVDHTKQFGSNAFRNGTGILRNVSAANSQARHLLRKQPNLIESLLHFLNLSLAKNQVDTRSVENAVCILRNLSYRVEEVVNPKYNPNDRSRTSGKKERSKSAPSGDRKPKKKSGGLFKKSKKSKEGETNGTAFGPALLWHPDTVKLYLRLLQESSNSDTLEASAAAIQNLAACQFDGSVQVRQTVRQEKGLSILTELLKVQDEKVLTAVATALRNLVLDQSNCELIGKNAMSSLIEKLPEVDEQRRDPKINDATLSAILGILFEIVKSNVHLTKNLHELGGTARLRKLARSYPTYSARVCKYASQVLFMMWQHKELHDGFKRAGLKEADFYSGSSSHKHRDTTTLSRPISSQGAERPSHLQAENLDDSAESAAAAYAQLGSNQRFNDHQQMTPNSDRSGASTGHYGSAAITPQQQYQTPGEPLYASVNKRNGRRRGSIGGDSWV